MAESGLEALEPAGRMPALPNGQALAEVLEFS